MLDTLASAALFGNGELVAKLLKEGGDVDEISLSRTALGAASTKNFTNIVNTLLEHGATVDMFDGMGKTPLIDCAWMVKTTEVVRILLEHNVSDCSPLIGLPSGHHCSSITGAVGWEGRHLRKRDPICMCTAARHGGQSGTLLGIVDLDGLSLLINMPNFLRLALQRLSRVS